jgi:hypothetical protein
VIDALVWVTVKATGFENVTLIPRVHGLPLACMLSCLTGNLHLRPGVHAVASWLPCKASAGAHVSEFEDETFQVQQCHAVCFVRIHAGTFTDMRFS